MDENISKVISDVCIFAEGHLVHGNLVIGADGRIAEIQETPDSGEAPRWLLPGVIDTHVHFREPGLTQKADIASESRAAAAGGVTYVLDMPNVKPTTTTPEALADKHRLFQEKCVVNYGLWSTRHSPFMVGPTRLIAMKSADSRYSSVLRPEAC